MALRAQRLVAAAIDQRLSAIRSDVVAGRRYEQTFELFRLTYFPRLDESATADVLGGWCARHGIKADLQPRRVQAGSKPYQVI